MESTIAIWDLYDHYTKKSLELGRVVNNRREPMKEETISDVGKYKMVRVVDSKLIKNEEGLPHYAVFVRILMQQDNLVDV